MKKSKAIVQKTRQRNNMAFRTMDRLIPENGEKKPSPWEVIVVIISIITILVIFGAMFYCMATGAQ